MLNLEDFDVAASLSSAAPQKWNARHPPTLAADGVSHFWGALGEDLTAFLFPDLVVSPEPVEIEASPDNVWDVLLAFDRYGEWNRNPPPTHPPTHPLSLSFPILPVTFVFIECTSHTAFHSRVDIVEMETGGIMAVRMEVNMGPLMGKLVSTETIWYLDSVRHIFVYGVGRDGPSSLRVVYLEALDAGTRTLFHSYDVIGGYPGLLSRGYIHGIVLDGFTAQHSALRERVHELFPRTRK